MQQQPCLASCMHSGPFDIHTKNQNVHVIVHDILNRNALVLFIFEHEISFIKPKYIDTSTKQFEYIYKLP